MTFIVSVQAALLLILKDYVHTFTYVFSLIFFCFVIVYFLKKMFCANICKTLFLYVEIINTVVWKLLCKSFAMDGFSIKTTPKPTKFISFYPCREALAASLHMKTVTLMHKVEVWYSANTACKRFTWQCSAEKSLLLEPSLLFFSVLAGKTGEIKVFFLQGPFPPFHLQADKLQRERWPSASGY